MSPMIYHHHENPYLTPSLIQFLHLCDDITRSES